MKPALLALCLFSAAANAANGSADISVTVEGAVHAPGVHGFKGAPRLSDAVKASPPRPDAYLLGAALLRPSLQHEQLRLRAGLLHDLALLRGHGEPGVASTAAGLTPLIEAMPATGRSPHLLAQDLIAVRRDLNALLEDGDRLVYPVRPDVVQVLGAVEQACAIHFDPRLDAADYRNRCRVIDVADPDVLFIIQPDGTVMETGIALWNHSEQPVATGAVLYVPLRPRLIREIAPDFNTEFARMLATQPLPAEGIAP